jgi:hypothetical protein
MNREPKNASLEQSIQQLLLNNLSKSKKATEGKKICTQNALRWGKQSTLLKIARLANKLLQPFLAIHNRTQQVMEKRTLGCTINNTAN